MTQPWRRSRDSRPRNVPVDLVLRAVDLKHLSRGENGAYGVAATLTEVEAMTQTASAPTRSAFRHEALLYRGEQDFLDTAVPFLQGAVDAGEAALVVVGSERIAALKERLPDAPVMYADMADVGANPGRIIPAWTRFVAEHGTPSRGIGEPIWPGRPALELEECQLHESLLNVALRGGRRVLAAVPLRHRGAGSARRRRRDGEPSRGDERGPVLGQPRVPGVRRVHVPGRAAGPAARAALALPPVPGAPRGAALVRVGAGVTAPARRGPCRRPGRGGQRAGGEHAALRRRARPGRLLA